MKLSTHTLLSRIEPLGFSPTQANQIRLIEKTLHHWAEAECNGEIQRDEETGKPRRNFGIQMAHSYPIADKENGALKRLAAIVKTVPSVHSYHQTDPRGCALYLITKAQLGSNAIDCAYTNGLAVCD